jgi:30S ribosomal protein S31
LPKQLDAGGSPALRNRLPRQFGQRRVLSWAPALVSYATFKHIIRSNSMGRGDRKTRKGKIAKRSYGNMRPHKAAAGARGAVVAKKAATPAKPAVKKIAPVAKKAAPKKPG